MILPPRPAPRRRWCAALGLAAPLFAGCFDGEPEETGTYEAPIYYEDTEAPELDTAIFYLFQIWGEHPSYSPDTATIQIDQASSRWEGPMSVALINGSFTSYICYWSYRSWSETPVTDCPSCDFAFKVEHEFNEALVDDRCDAMMDYYGYSPDYFAPHQRWGYEHGGLNFWQQYSYDNTGLMWYQYAGAWYPSYYTYNYFAESEGDDPDQLHFYVYISYGYYYQ